MKLRRHRFCQAWRRADTCREQPCLRSAAPLAAMNSPVAHCRNGSIRGSELKLQTNERQSVFCYRNIPYAKPPVGNLRFLGPQPAEPWEGILDGTVIGKSPMQQLEMANETGKYYATKKLAGNRREDMDEDCLHLSIYTPKTTENAKLPVMIWFYGGGFQVGSERLFDGSALAGMFDVLVVVINYRVNVFGFLSLGASSPCPGNAGLFDQRLAMQWVKDNIAGFGGNKDNVTIFGNSAGGASVNHHINSSMSRGLFHKAISQSGQATLPNFFSYEPAKSTKALIDYFDIKETDEANLLLALQSIPASELIKATADEKMKAFHFHPCVDGKLVQQEPEYSLADKNAKKNKVPYIIGCNNAEGHGLMAMFFGVSDFAAGITEERMKSLLRAPEGDSAYKAWKDFYMKDEDEGWTIYMYHCTFQPRLYHDMKYGPGLGRKVDWCICDHAEETLMVFGVPFTPGELLGGGKFSKEEEELSRTFMAYITNFAKHGDPNQGEIVDAKWPRYKEDKKHMTINHPATIGDNLGADVVKFWAKQK